MNAKKVFCFIMAGILALSSCACQKAPSEKTVSSKSSGTTNYTSSATASGTGDIGEAVRVKNEEQFFSTDDSVEFTFNIDKAVPVSAMPVVRVSPDFLSEEDAKRVANVLFGEVDYYESEPVFSPQYSKDEIQERIRRWSPFTKAQAVQELYGQPMDHVVGIVQSFIEEYTLQFEQAPDESPHKPCAWKFRKTSEYRYSDEQIREEQIDTSADNDEITASLRVNNIEYQFNAATRNKKDYKLNYISAYPYTGISPNGIDSLIVSSQLCRTEKPTDEEMSYAFSLADAWLGDMELGEWSIDQCSVKTTYYGDVPEYVICISAVPVLHGTNAIRYPQLDNLKS